MVSPYDSIGSSDEFSGHNSRVSCRIDDIIAVGIARGKLIQRYDRVRSELFDGFPAFHPEIINMEEGVFHRESNSQIHAFIRMDSICLHGNVRFHMTMIP